MVEPHPDRVLGQGRPRRDDGECDALHRLAAANNIQGVLFEGWNDAWHNSDAKPDFDFTSPAPDYDVAKVAAYAREKGIYLITHNETGGNYLRFEDQLERTLDWDASLGIHAMKTGYAGGGLYGGAPRHSQTGVRHFQKVVEEAAERQIMVDGHEVIKETGLRRTWPNFMTRECVRGMEYNGWGPGNPPSHTVILPYTPAERSGGLYPGRVRHQVHVRPGQAATQHLGPAELRFLSSTPPWRNRWPTG